jgi:O-antigen ligase
MSAVAVRLSGVLVAAGTVLLGLGLAASTAAVAVGEVLLLAAVLVDWRRTAAAKPWREPVMALGLALLAFIALRTVMADPTLAGVRKINQYQELLFAPVLLAAWLEPRRQRLLFKCFIAGCVIVALWLWASHASQHTYELAQRQRIGASFALAVAAYLLVLRAPAAARRWPHIATAAFFALTIVFGIDGRTGLVVLVLLAACAAWVLAPKRWRILAAVGVPALLAAIALLSPGVQGRIDEMEAAWHSTQVPSEADSSGIRLQLLRITTEAVREHWLAGVGYSRYPQAHRAAAQAVYAGRPDGAVFLSRFWSSLNNPHSEYVMQVVGGGVAGAALFLAWLAAGLWQARRMHSPALAGLVLAFAAGCAVNSMLLDFVEGHLYVALVAWLVAEWRAAKTPFRT